MKNILLLLLFIMCNFITHSQWSFKKVDNGFDEPYKIAYTKNVDGAYLKLENIEGQIAFYIQGNFTCDEEVSIDLAFLINSQYERFSFNGLTSEDHYCVFFSFDFLNSIAINAFKDASILKVRINDTICESQIYTFKMNGSTLALNYMK